MTRDELIKSLVQCSVICSCADCPQRKTENHCMNEVLRAALDKILELENAISAMAEEEEPKESGYERFTEIFKLKEMLEAEHIPFEFFKREKFPFGYQIVCKADYGKLIWSAVQNKLSYGNDMDLIEIMRCKSSDGLHFHNEIEGRLNAESVFELIEEEWERREKK